MRWGLLFTALIGVSFASPAFAHIENAIPDGDSGTTVSYDEDGRALVDIASPVSEGVSDNTLDRFNGTEVGFSFDNHFH